MTDEQRRHLLKEMFRISQMSLNEFRSEGRDQLNQLYEWVNTQPVSVPEEGMRVTLWCDPDMEKRDADKAVQQLMMLSWVDSARLEDNR